MSADHNLDGGLRKDTLFTDRVVSYHIAWQKDKYTCNEGIYFDNVPPSELVEFKALHQRVFPEGVKAKIYNTLKYRKNICRQNKGTVESESGGTLCNQKAYK